MRKLVRLLASLLGAGLILAGLGVILLERRFDAPGPLAEERRLLIERGSGVAAIARQLEAAGVVEDDLLFRLLLLREGGGRQLRAGEYLFPADVSLRETARLLLEGRSYVRRLTVPEGLSSVQVVQLLAAAPGLFGELEGIPPEGSLLPETYHYSWGDSRAGLLQAMQEHQRALLSELWPNRAKDLPFETETEALVLASIVEKETGVPEERPLVAGVFVNRLRQGMLLQSDPTVIFALTEGKRDLGRSLTRKDLEIESPFNTYVSPGLPPAPIANPGRAALEAVLNPPAVEFLYFVADGTGGHRFAKTLEEHNRNVAYWRSLRQRGGGS